MYVAKVVNRALYINRAKLTERAENASRYSHPSAARLAISRFDHEGGVFGDLVFEVVRAPGRERTEG